MRIYECGECGVLKLAKDWVYCENGHKPFAMYEVLQFGKYGSDGLVAHLKETLKQGVKTRESGGCVNVLPDSLNDDGENVVGDVGQVELAI